MSIDPIFLLEMGIVAVIVVLQFLVFFRNQSAINTLGKIFPRLETLNVKKTSISEQGEDQTVVPVEIDLIEDKPGFSKTFRSIVHTTNAYLTRNRGGADFEILEEIAERKAESQENAIESNISLPLYIGLLCTFTGVIIGLIKIATDGVSDQAITSFVGGVLIGMIGSATGLALTVLSNHLFKDQKKQRDANQYDYFTFLRTYILPTQLKESETPISTLRTNLAAFNDGFAKYQEHMNTSLGETLRLFNELKDVFKQIRSIEQGLNGMGHFLQANDGLIEKQVAYIDSYAKKAEALTQKLSFHFSTVDKQVETMVNENIKALDQSTQAAYVKMDQYLASLTNADTKAFAEALQKDLTNIKGDIETLQSKSLEVNTRLLQHLGQEGQTNLAIDEQVKNMNLRLDKLAAAQEESIMNSGVFQFFVYTGVAAFVTGIVGGFIYIINTFAG